ncbi:MAG: arylesterase [Desulfuromonadales bacterium]|nr:arylesterase [Desulfuromonadales bacterium]
MPSKTLVLLLLSLWLSATPVSANATAEATIAVLGDSLTAGYGLERRDAFPAQLERALRQSGWSVTVLNAGVSGDTTAGGLARLDWLLADRPQAVIVALGANDALRGLPPEQSFNNLDAILERLRAAGVRVLLAGMLAPRNLGDDYVNRFDRTYPELAARHQVALYPFFLAGVATEPALNQADGIHPNAAGVARIVEQILPDVIQLLEMR